MCVRASHICSSSLPLSSIVPPLSVTFFFFNDTATTEIYTLSLHDALPICADDRTRADPEAGADCAVRICPCAVDEKAPTTDPRSEEHTSELQSLTNLVCRLLLEKKKKKTNNNI